MKQIRHPNILPALSSFVVNYDICIVTPLMRMGSARDVLDSHFPEGRQIIINKCDFSTAAEIRLHLEFVYSFMSVIFQRLA